jgi:hypothetical protein
MLAFGGVGLIAVIVGVVVVADHVVGAGLSAVGLVLASHSGV